MARMLFVMCVTPGLLVGGAGVGVAGGDAASCEAGWVSGIGVPGVEGQVSALAVFDDGTGAALYVGGRFPAAGGVGANHIARWDGSGWSALEGPGGNGMGGLAFPSMRVAALAVFDDGTGAALYAGGSFTTAGGEVAHHVARWDGTGWSALVGPSGNGVGGVVNALAVFDDGTGPALYAGGGFTTAGGVAANRIAKWDGSSWSALDGPNGNGVNDFVSALEVFDDGGGAALYAGGAFTSASGVAANRIVRWDGVGWSALAGPSGNGMDVGSVNALAVFDDGDGAALHAGGFFLSAGGVAANGIARWDGAEWSAVVGPGGDGVIGNTVHALAGFDDGSGPALYAGGDFSTGTGVAANRIARWDGQAWSLLEGASGNGVGDQGFDAVRALAVFDGGEGAGLFVGGLFSTTSGVEANRIGEWRGCVAEPVPCVGDLTGDGVVDADDLGVLLGAFGGSDAGDLNDDGVTDADDLGILLGVFGNVCG